MPRQGVNHFAARGYLRCCYGVMTLNAGFGVTDRRTSLQNDLDNMRVLTYLDMSR